MLAIPVATLVCYMPALFAGTIWDDDQYVTGTLAIRSLRNLMLAWTVPGYTPQYYPLVFTSFWVEYQLWGLRPFGYHLTNVLLHAGSALMFWSALRRLKVPGAWLAGLVFAIHPVNVESVAWITERKNTLSTFFYLLSMLGLIRFYGLDSPAGPLSPQIQRKAYFLALVFFVCALLSKTVTCSLPIAILILVYWKRGRLSPRDAAPMVPFIAMGMIMGLVTAWVERTHVAASGPAWALSAAERGLIAGRAVCFYLWKLIWPADLTFIYPRWEINASDWRQFLFPLAIIAALSATWFLKNRIGRAPFAALFFFVVTLFPALGFVNVYPMRYSFVADHFQYLATLGPIALFAGSLGSMGGQRPVFSRVLLCALLSLSLTLGMLTWRQARTYRDSVTLWESNLERNPRSAVAMVNLGTAYFHLNQPERALDMVRRGIEIDPAWDFYINEGNILAAMGRLDEATISYKNAAEKDPANFRPLVLMAQTLTRNRKPREALNVLDTALKSDPANPEIHLAAGAVYADVNDQEQARLAYQKALDLARGPLHEQTRFRAYWSLGAMAWKDGDYAATIEFWQKALEINPDVASLNYQLGLACFQRGDTAQGVDFLRKALELARASANHDLENEIRAALNERGFR